MLLEISGERTPERMKGWRQSKNKYPAVDVTGDRSKVWCYKEQYCIGTCNVRSMNQGKLDVVKQEMARVNVDILGISELKWTGMGELVTFKSLGFPIGSVSKESACKTGGPGSISELVRSPGEGNGNLFQYSCLGNPIDRGTWWATVHGVAKSWTWLSD